MAGDGTERTCWKVELRRAAGLVGEYAGLVGEYAGLVGEYAGLVGEYAGLVGEYARLGGEYAIKRGGEGSFSYPCEGILAQDASSTTNNLPHISMVPCLPSTSINGPVLPHSPPLMTFTVSFFATGVGFSWHSSA
jgi:hypothetical protein